MAPIRYESLWQPCNPLQNSYKLSVTFNGFSLASLTDNQKVRACTFLASKHLKWFDFCGFLTTVYQALASLTLHRKLFQCKTFIHHLYGVFQVARPQQGLEASFPVFPSAGHSYPNSWVSCQLSTYCAWRLVIQIREWDPYFEGTCVQSCWRETRIHETAGVKNISSFWKGTEKPSF